MPAFLRPLAFLLAALLVSFLCWHFFTYLNRTGLIVTLLLFFAWQAFIVHIVVFELLGAFTRTYNLEPITCMFVGAISCILCGISIA